jgi:hypothetical protein
MMSTILNITKFIPNDIFIKAYLLMCLTVMIELVLCYCMKFVENSSKGSTNEVN